MGSTVIETGRTRPGTHRVQTDVCVIGSGAGGAVASAVLAEGGREVVILEQGAYQTASDFDQREDTMLPRLFEDVCPCHGSIVTGSLVGSRGTPAVLWGASPHGNDFGE